MSKGLSVVVCSLLFCVQAVNADDPWADSIVSYDAGTGADPEYSTASLALGAPTRIASGNFGSVGSFGSSVVSPFSPAGGVDEVVTLGVEGQLTVKFDTPVANDTNNPYGIDLLVFGNAFFSTSDFNFDQNTTVAGVASEGGIVSISQDGVTFVPVSVQADGAFPTNGYADTTEFFPAAPGSVLSDFTKPVNPNFELSVVGLGPAAIVAGYNGSGGGAGIDIGAYGFSQISYVRVTNPAGSITTPEIDAFADVSPVPEPSGGIIAIFGVAGALGCRKKWMISK